MDAALNSTPIALAIFVASLDGFISDVKMAANWVDTSAVPPDTLVSVAKAAINSSIPTPRVAAFAVTLGNAEASWSNEVTPFLAVI